MAKMKSMPDEIKDKLRQLQKTCSLAKELEIEVYTMIEQYGVEPDHLNANSDLYKYRVRTEALAYVSNAEGDIEQNIAEIEEVFLHYANMKK